MSGALFAKGSGELVATEDFVRYESDTSGARLETILCSYERADVQVDLIGAVHVADTTYYDYLNKLFLNYDALLYELVGKWERKALSEKKTSVVTFLQRGVKDFLKLEHQLDKINYDAPNFVHADMTKQQFYRTQKAQGESFVTLLTQAFSEQMGRGKSFEELSWLDLMRIFMSKDRANEMKRFLAQQLSEMEGVFSGAQDTVIIGGRNQVAIEKLKQAMSEKKTRVGIFYGAAHLEDLEERLYALGFKKKKERWITAWRMPKEK